MNRNGLLAGAVTLALTSQLSAEAVLMSRDHIRNALPAQDTAYAKQTSEGEVTLEVWPQWQDGVLVVEVKANTHSVDLSGVNLMEQVRLTVNLTEVTPTRAGSLGGHHAVATLVFTLQERPESFTIRIRNVPDVPVRVLSWETGKEG